MTSSPSARPAGQVDFELVFQLLPGMCLVLDPAFTILAQNAEHARATLSEGKNVVGRISLRHFPTIPITPPPMVSPTCAPHFSRC